MTKIGYARVSTGEQDPALQLDALREAGCIRVFADVASGTLDSRPQLDALLEYVRPGDQVVVWKLDRLGRSMRHLIALAADLAERGVELRSIRDAIDSSTPTGKLIFHVLGALAEFEADLIRERTRAGLVAARARGRHGGRPTVVSAERVEVIQRMYADRSHTIDAIARTVGVGRSTVYRVLRSSAHSAAP